MAPATIEGEGDSRVSSSMHWLWLSFKDQSLEEEFHMKHLEELSRSRRQSRVMYMIVALGGFNQVAFAFMLLVPELHFGDRPTSLR